MVLPRRLMAPGSNLLSRSWNIGSSLSAPAASAAGIALFWRLPFSVPSRNALNFFSTANAEAPRKDGAKSSRGKRDVSMSGPITGSSLMEKKNPLRKVIPPPQLGIKSNLFLGELFLRSRSSRPKIVQSNQFGLPLPTCSPNKFSGRRERRRAGRSSESLVLNLRTLNSELSTAISLFDCMKEPSYNMNKREDI